MSGAKKAATPLATSTYLSFHGGSASIVGDEHRKLLGSLQYLIITRPDISFIINKLSQYMHKSTQHMMALKRVLRYLKGTLHYGMNIFKDKTLELTA